MRQKVENRIAVERDRALINNALKRYLTGLKGPRILRKAMEYAIFSGGKRLRPVLTLESSRALNGDIKKALPFACAIEFVHNFSLIHDDLPAMDNDDMRRGKPTCHKKFGEGLAILTGDALLNLAFGLLSDLKENKTPEATFLLSDAIGVQNMIGGQVLDVTHGRGLKWNKRFRNKINRMKTAALIATSCKAGALIAGARPRDIKRMYEFGINLGLAFQIADDIKDSRHSAPVLGRMKKETKSFIAKAEKQLEPFRKKADTLKYIANTVLKHID
ncbi:MAG: polyprenyl synthetase family protein [Candidatus Omnitrophota bacterium]|nr:MAG: polyprenyl synthetase family protein [Candidatus Omnitrophota bacterium]